MDIVITKELRPEPAKTHGGLARVVTWRIYVNGVEVARDYERYQWDEAEEKMEPTDNIRTVHNALLKVKSAGEKNTTSILEKIADYTKPAIQMEPKRAFKERVDAAHQLALDAMTYGQAFVKVNADGDAEKIGTEDVLAERLSVGRWNVERDGHDILVCKGEHEKGEDCEYERFVPAATLASEKARADAAEAERNTFKAKDASKSKLLERFRDLLLNMCDHFEDEGGRVYFGSTNDPDELREIAQKMDAWKWDAIMGQTTSDPYADLREQRARAEKAEATIASLTVKLEEAMDALQPFAALANAFDPDEGDDEQTPYDLYPGTFTIGHLRRARATRNRIKQDGGGTE